jgi:hypothetical protein
MELKAFFVCPLVGMLALLLALAKLEKEEKRLITAGWVAHVIGSFAIAVYHKKFSFGGGDMLNYSIEGRPLSRLLETDFAYYGPEILKVALHLEHRLPFQLILEGPGATMCALTAFMKLFVGDTIYGEALLISFFVFAGLASLYRGLRPKLDAFERTPALIALFLIPSAIFWTSGIVKEAIVVGCLGFLGGSLARIGQGRAVSIIGGVLGCALAAVGIATIKPYALFPFALALGGWFYAKRTQGLSFTYRILGLAVAVAGLVVISRAFPEFGVDTINGRINQLQHGFREANQRVNAESGIDIGGDAQEERGLGGQLLFAPVGLLNALFRPFLFEANNIPMFVAAIEMTVLFVLTVSLFRRPGIGAVIRTIRARPPLLFSVVFVVTFGTAVGLATLNLGSLSRYRVPMMPMYAGVLLVLRQRFRAAAPVASGQALGLKQPRPALVAARRAVGATSGRRGRFVTRGASG